MATKNFSITKDSLLAYNGTNLGGGDDDHLITGYYSGYRFRSLLQFALDWTGVVQITSAVLKMRTTSGVHVVKGGDPTITARRNTASWTENSGRSSYDSPSGSGWSGASTDYAYTSWTDDGVGNYNVPTSSGTWTSFDITEIVDQWAPASVKKSTGAAGGGAANYGLAILATPEVDTSETAEFYSRESSYDPYIVLTYSTNSAPNAPTLTYPISGARVTDTTPTLTFVGSDPDPGDTIDHYDIGLEPTTGYGVEASWAGTYGITFATTGISGQNVSWTAPTLPRGQWYQWRAKTVDAGGLAGPFSATQWFRVNALPVGTKVTNNTTALPYIHNLATDLAAWTSGGNHAKARFAWTYSDADGDAQASAKVRIYAASTGGSPLNGGGAGETISGTATTLNSSYQLINGTSYWWTIEVVDAYGESSGESSRGQFHVRWGQVLYEYAPTGGASSGSWQFSSATVAAGTQKAILFGATGSSGTAGISWKSTIGAVAPNVYAKFLVRLATNVSGTNPSLDWMTFSYVGTALQPDRWTFVPSGDWLLDADVRRFGTKSLRCAVTASAGNRFAYPYLNAVDDDVIVQPSTDYTFSAFVKTESPLTHGTIRLRVNPAGDNGNEISEWYTDTSRRETTDSTVDWDGSSTPEGWLRLVLRFTTGPATTRVRPMIHYTHDDSSSGDVFWWDAVKLEEGSVATAWTPGFIADAVVLDAGGIAVDAFAGGILQLRGADGGARDVVSLGNAGLVFGGDAEISAPTADEGIALPKLRITDNTDDVTLASTNEPFRIGSAGSANLAMDGNEIHARNNGAASQLNLNADGGPVVINVSSLGGDGGLTLGSSGHLTMAGLASRSGLAPIRRSYSSGSSTWSKPDGLAYIEVEVIGGGGGSGGVSTTAAGEGAASGGGGGGGYARKLLTAADLSGASSFSYAVGGGGSAGTAGTNNGGGGGTSSFSGTGITTVFALGGAGGTGGSASSGRLLKAGGAGGSGSNGDLNFTGADGGTGHVVNGDVTAAAYGGAAAFGGGGGAGPTASGVGSAGNPYGGGGGGSYNQDAQGTARTGSAGAAGRVVVTEFYL